MTLLIMVGVLLVLLLIRVPVAFALLVPAVGYVLLDSTASTNTAVQQTLAGVNQFPILAVPMFILLGNLANESGATDRIYDTATAFLGRIRGSLGYVNVATSFGFSWMSGAAIADAAAMGRVQVPAMIKRGYSPRFAVGITGGSSIIAPLIPPSIPAIIYAVTAGLSVGALFLTGIMPAMVLIAVLCLLVWWFTRKQAPAGGETPSWGARGKSLLGSLPVAGAAVVILGGILSGIVTPTEASAVGVLYILLLSLAYRQMTWKKLYRVAIRTLETTGSVLLIVCAAALFGWVLARERAPQEVSELILGVTNNPIVFLLLVNVFLIIVGALLEPTSAILIVVPVLAPIADTFSIDPLHFAAIVIFNLMLGLLTPPVGLVLFVLSSVTGMSVPNVVRGVLPFFAAMLVVLLMITYMPMLSLWLPGVFGVG